MKCRHASLTGEFLLVLHHHLLRPVGGKLGLGRLLAAMGPTGDMPRPCTSTLREIQLCCQQRLLRNTGHHRLIVFELPSGRAHTQCEPQRMQRPSPPSRPPLARAGAGRPLPAAPTSPASHRASSPAGHLPTPVLQMILMADWGCCCSRPHGLANPAALQPPVVLRLCCCRARVRQLRA